MTGPDDAARSLTVRSRSTTSGAPELAAGSLDVPVTSSVAAASGAWRSRRSAAAAGSARAAAASRGGPRASSVPVRQPGCRTAAVAGDRSGSGPDAEPGGAARVAAASSVRLVVDHRSSARPLDAASRMSGSAGARAPRRQRTALAPAGRGRSAARGRGRCCVAGAAPAPAAASGRASASRAGEVARRPRRRSAPVALVAGDSRSEPVPALGERPGSADRLVAAGPSVAERGSSSSERRVRPGRGGCGPAPASAGERAPRPRCRA